MVVNELFILRILRCGQVVKCELIRTIGIRDMQEWALSVDGLSGAARAELEEGLTAAGYKVSAEASNASPLCVVRVLGQEIAEISVKVPDPLLPARPITRTSRLASRWSENEGIRPLAFRAAQLMGASAHYKEAADSIRSGKAIAFVGSGLSIEAGYKGWDGLLRNLSDEACLVDIEEQIRQGGELALQLAGRCKRALGDERYFDLLGELFRENANGCTVQQIEIMQIPFASYMTSNFDPCLEVAAEHAKKKPGLHIWPNLPHSGLDKGDIFYLHGKVPRVNQAGQIKQIRLTVDDYKDAYEASTYISSLISEVTRTEHTLIFFGYGLRDPAIQQVLKTAKQEREKQREFTERYGQQPAASRSHFAFVGSNELSYQDSLLLFRECQVEVIDFELQENDFSELKERIRDLFIRTAQPERPPVLGMDGAIIPEATMQGL